jgi:hypothetical protein
LNKALPLQLSRPRNEEHALTARLSLRVEPSNGCGNRADKETPLNQALYVRHAFERAEENQRARQLASSNCYCEHRRHDRPLVAANPHPYALRKIINLLAETVSKRE